MLRKIAFSLVLIMIFMIPWEGVVSIQGIGSLTKIIGFSAFGAWVGLVLATGEIRKPRPFHVVLVIFLIWNIATISWSQNTNLTRNRIFTYIQVAILMWLIWNLFLTKDSIRVAMQAYVLGASVSVYNTLYNYFLGLNTGRHSVRFTAFGINENELALMLALAIPIAWTLAVSAEKNGKLGFILKVINYVYVPLAVFAILLTASRTALFAMLPAFWLILSSFSRLKPFPRLIIAVGMVGAIYILQPLVPQTSIDRLSTTTTEIDDGTLGGRTDNWTEGINLFLEHPVQGVGTGAYRAVTEKGKVAHNTYLSLIVEVGFVGITLFLIIILLTIHNVRKLPTKWDTMLWVTVLAIWAISVSTITYEHKKPTWLILSLIAAGAGAYEQYSGVINIKRNEEHQKDSPAIIVKSTS